MTKTMKTIFFELKTDEELEEGNLSKWILA